MIYLSRIRYVGTEFCGFQVQKNGRTVQGDLGAAAEKLFGCPCTVTGCSRTDSGVHAEEFFLTLEPTDKNAPKIPPAALPAAILQFLPPDLSLNFAVEAPAGFHPRFDALGKEYHYRIRYGGVPDPFRVGLVWQLPYTLTDEGLDAMKAAATHFLGAHDFTSFMCPATTIEDHVRTVTKMTVERVGDEVVIAVAANGFLYNMVRIMTGTLFEIGAGRRSIDSIDAAFLGRDRVLGGMTAPPDGLYLPRVFYSKKLETLLGRE